MPILIPPKYVHPPVAYEFFIPVTLGTNGLSALGSFPVASLYNLHDEARISFKVPYDFVSIMDADIIVIPINTNQQANWDIFSEYGQLGEFYYTHMESDIASLYNVENNILSTVDIKGILTNLVAGDIVGIELVVETAPGHGVHVLGVRFRYIAAV